MGYCYASNKYFANLYDCEIRTIRRWLHSLESLGYVKVDIIKDEKNKILERRIYTKESLNILNDNEGIIPSGQESPRPEDKNVPTPKDKNVLYNNIYINNILHNNIQTQKNEYHERVYLTENQHEELKNELGEEKLEKCLTELSLYKKSKNVEYADDYSAIKRWVIDKIESKENEQKNKITKKYRSYNQREYDNLDEFYDN